MSFSPFVFVFCLLLFCFWGVIGGAKPLYCPPSPSPVRERKRRGVDKGEFFPLYTGGAFSTSGLCFFCLLFFVFLSLCFSPLGGDRRAFSPYSPLFTFQGAFRLFSNLPILYKFTYIVPLVFCKKGVWGALFAL